MSAADIMEGVDAVIVSHTNLDHRDDAAQELLPKGIPLFSQDEIDAQIIRGSTAQILYSSRNLVEILGKVKGIVFQAPGSKTVYITSDTAWDSEVDQTLAKFNPDVIILNTGDAHLTGFNGSMIMEKDDTLHAHWAAPNLTIITVNMGVINHTALTCKELWEYVQQKTIQDHLIFDNGKSLKF
ncbi:hypothetical protein BGZ81_001566 [Podila clonocystis]|nr:hypothetical protein BGZ81_001566 [Podila clonocystis]